MYSGWPTYHCVRLVASLLVRSGIAKPRRIRSQTSSGAGPIAAATAWRCASFERGAVAAASPGPGRSDGSLLLSAPAPIGLSPAPTLGAGAAFSAGGCDASRSVSPPAAADGGGGSDTGADADDGMEATAFAAIV